jgi:hypothetical protein
VEKQQKARNCEKIAVDTDSILRINHELLLWMQQKAK